MPADYVNKLARMFQDVKVSEDLNQAFKEMHKNNRLAMAGIHRHFLCLVELVFLVDQEYLLRN